MHRISNTDRQTVLARKLLNSHSQLAASYTLTCLSHSSEEEEEEEEEEV